MARIPTAGQQCRQLPPDERREFYLDECRSGIEDVPSAEQERLADAARRTGCAEDQS